MAGNFFRGTNAEQDSRWGGDKALMKKMERADMFSKVLETKVDLRRVNIPVISKWITGKITQLLGYEDDIVIGTCINFLEADGKLDPRKLQMQLTGFLEKKTRLFMEELWSLLLDAQKSLNGIPVAFLEQKKQEFREQEQNLSKPKSHVIDRDNHQSKDNAAPDSNNRRESRWGKPLPKRSNSRERRAERRSLSRGRSSSPNSSRNNLHRVPFSKGSPTGRIDRRHDAELNRSRNNVDSLKSKKRSLSRENSPYDKRSRKKFPRDRKNSPSPRPNSREKNTAKLKEKEKLKCSVERNPSDHEAVLREKALAYLKSSGKGKTNS